MKSWNQQKQQQTKLFVLWFFITLAVGPCPHVGYICDQVHLIKCKRLDC